MGKLTRWVLIFALIVLIVAPGDGTPNDAESDAGHTSEVAADLSVLEGQPFSISQYHGKLC
jgi:hypothetical protein